MLNFFFSRLRARATRQYALEAIYFAASVLSSCVYFELHVFSLLPAQHMCTELLIWQHDSARPHLAHGVGEMPDLVLPSV